MNTDLKINITDFSQIREGEKFYTSRISALSEDKTYFRKVATTKSSNGMWTNAKDCFGTDKFIKYDAKVWTVK